MAFELTANNFNNGQGYVVMPLLASLMLFSSLTAPVSIADMRAELETDQPQPFEDDDWNVLVGQLAAVQLNTSVLTGPERAIYNTLRAAASPPPSTRCCGTVIPAFGDGATQGFMYFRTGSVTNEVQIELHVDKSYTCDIATIELTLGVVATGPVPTPATFDMDFVTCTDTGKAVYTYLWVGFPTDPTGEDYNFEFNFKDAAGVTLATYAASYNTTVQ